MSSLIDLQAKIQEASKLAESLERSLALQKKFPRIFEENRVSLMVQTKATATGVNCKQLPYKAWLADGDTKEKLEVVDAAWYLGRTKERFTDREIKIIKGHWDEL